MNLNQRHILVINGPNLNFLGRREEHYYGDQTLDEIIKNTEEKLKDTSVKITWFQSNHEGQIIDKIQWMAEQNFDGLVINPGAYSHTSLAIQDALSSVKQIKVEVHLSNVYQREKARRRLLTACACDTIMCGLGSAAYYLGILAILQNKER